jgi:hypothetical protein
MATPPTSAMFLNEQTIHREQRRVAAGVVSFPTDHVRIGKSNTETAECHCITGR